MTDFWESSDLGLAEERVRYTAWQAHVAGHDAADTIAVQNLQVTVEAGNDAWGRRRNQPCLVTVKMHLANPFLAAAQADSLDASTVHYGILSKNIRSTIETSKGSYVNTEALLRDIRAAVERTTGATRLRALELGIFYPKGSLLGDGAGAVLCQSKDARGHRVCLGMYLKNVRIPCIIGVNANERQQKQPVVVNLWIDPIPTPLLDQQHAMERRLVDFVSESSFETLEALSTQVVDEMAKMFHQVDDGFITLRVEKPMAVPFADGPVIEMRRRIARHRHEAE
ncbi:uncharacterized protein EI97DRAFT_428738 [Westerdykella ornata]|uniref:dihydroneopterin aldolase n=1 Tax=Westerdykella ornata TaxID=318751 RepID=A0A6A6JVK1_WESOR|nr:uncharacterized protein EI97DRAFT_428738 [Westerdykella ornata]KAF2280641.1 hypothetical protein EI97DRAFT_428738 [Westerdykella ornata]